MPADFLTMQELLTDGIVVGYDAPLVVLLNRTTGETIKLSPDALTKLKDWLFLLETHKQDRI